MNTFCEFAFDQILQKLDCKVGLTSIRFNPRLDPLVAGGSYYGEVHVWDCRSGSAPVQTSTRQHSHTVHSTCRPVNNIIFAKLKFYIS